MIWVMAMGEFKKAKAYLINLSGGGDELDKMVAKLINSSTDANRVRKALDERFNKGAAFVPGIDRNWRKTRIKRVAEGVNRSYMIEGTDGSWYKPEEKVWALAMFELGRIGR